MFAHGQGVPQDEKKAMQWLEKAAQGGDDESRQFLDNVHRAAGAQCARIVETGNVLSSLTSLLLQFLTSPSATENAEGE